MMAMPCSLIYFLTHPFAEIAPRSGLLRVREFCMGEIEHFVDPNDKSHPNFPSVADKEVVMFGRDDQLGSGKTKRVKIGEAVASGLVNNETLGYFMARTQLYMEKIGMDPERLRFRQHLATEMAHYAADCWDLEIKSSYGWVECVGHADRACYDLDVHGKATKTPMVATMKYDIPTEMEVAKLKFDRKVIGMVYKKDARLVSASLEALAEDWKNFEPIATALDTEGKALVDGYEVTKEMVTWEKAAKKVYEVKFVPSVIEPSFGMGRILYSLLEHSFYQRDMDEQRNVMKFNPKVAPQKCAVLPISSSVECNSVVDEIAAALMDVDLATRVDKSTAALGRRYARADEIGVPFAVTVDFDTLRDDTVTIRERDSMIQVRLPKKEVPHVLYDVVHGRMCWDDMTKKYPVVQVDDGEGDGVTVAGASFGAKTVVETTARGRFSRPAPVK
jgi:glycyl-tRNA synthetase